MQQASAAEWPGRNAYLETMFIQQAKKFGRREDEARNWAQEMVGIVTKMAAHRRSPLGTRLTRE